MRFQPPSPSVRAKLGCAVVWIAYLLPLSLAISLLVNCGTHDSSGRPTIHPGLCLAYLLVGGALVALTISLFTGHRQTPDR